MIVWWGRGMGSRTLQSSDLCKLYVPTLYLVIASRLITNAFWYYCFIIGVSWSSIWFIPAVFCYVSYCSPALFIALHVLTVASFFAFFTSCASGFCNTVAHVEVLYKNGCKFILTMQYASREVHANLVVASLVYRLCGNLLDVTFVFLIPPHSYWSWPWSQKIRWEGYRN